MAVSFSDVQSTFAVPKDLESHLNSIISKHKKPGRIEKTVKEAILNDSTGKQVVDIYEKTLVFLATESFNEKIKTLSERIDRKLSKVINGNVGDSKSLKNFDPNPEQLVRFETLKKGFKISDSFEDVEKDDPSIFAQYSCKLKDLPKLAKEVNKDSYKLAKKIDKKVASIATKSPKKKLSKDAFEKGMPGKVHAYKFNTTGRDIDGITLNASDVITPRQKYICSSLVHSSKSTQDYFTAALEQGSSLFVSLHEFKDARKGNPKFWDEKVLSKFPNEDGWKIKNLGNAVIGESDKLDKAKLTETKLVAEKGDEKRYITHIHHKGWKNGKPAPDEKLLQTLVNRIKELSSDPDHPIAINCQGGVGRTGITAAIHTLQSEIDHQLADGVELDDIEINIPETVFAFRSQRHGMLKSAKKIAQIYSVLSSYYKDLQA